jgi:enoyl-CoA hydratase
VLLGVNRRNRYFAFTNFGAAGGVLFVTGRKPAQIGREGIANMKYADFQFLKFDLKPNGAMLVTLNRAEAMNATNARLHWELTKVWDVVNHDPEVRVIVVTGAGDRAFSAGGDLSWISSTVGNAAQVTEIFKEAGDLVFNMLACDKPIISAINGVAVGAGLAVALMADISIMAEEAKITDGHVRIGVAAGDHSVILWPLLCGMAKAKYYLMTADFVDGKEAERIGLVSLCVPRAQLMDKAMATADKLATGSQLAIRFTKRSLNNWMRLSQPAFDASLALEMLCFLGEDAKEGIAAVREKREPQFPSARRTA